MSYSKYYSGGWQDSSSGGTPITAEALNHMEQGIIDSESISLTKITDCNNATDPRKYYYTDGDASNLNRPETGWCIIRVLFLNGNPASTAWSCTQLGMPMNSNVAKLYVRSRNTSGSWSAWKALTLS